jgi:hypothetical protein
VSHYTHRKLTPRHQMATHPLSVIISTRDSIAGRDVQQQYMVQTKHPRWELLKIFVHALTHLKFR